jgi:DNA/RNA-binding domain of Phe-tRNA-synthetase-like protein
MEAPIKLTKRMLVLADGKQIVCIYPYRDAETTKITEKTRNVVIIGYGAPKIHQNELINAVETALSFIQQTSGGRIEIVSIFKSEGNQ